MKILISGASGFVGSALSRLLKGEGHELTTLVRRAPRKGQQEIEWDPMEGSFDAGALEGLEAVVHLAGESIASGRWTEAKKKLIRDSRVKSTTYLSNALAGLSRPPKVFICASAIGYYGDRGDEKLTEKSPPGKNFLAHVCQQWEESTTMVTHQGIRTVNLRTSMVLGKDGGALKKMLLPFRLGLGGNLGDGQQYMSWITLDDLTALIRYLIYDTTLGGPINAASPHPVRNAEFTKTLGKVLGRPTLFPVPAAAAKLVFGEMANELLLASARVIPQQAQNSGFEFKHPQLEGALKSLGL